MTHHSWTLNVCRKCKTRRREVEDYIHEGSGHSIVTRTEYAVHPGIWTQDRPACNPNFAVPSPTVAA